MSVHCDIKQKKHTKSFRFDEIFSQFSDGVFACEELINIHLIVLSKDVCFIRIFAGDAVSDWDEFRPLDDEDKNRVWKRIDGQKAIITVSNV